MRKNGLIVNMKIMILNQLMNLIKLYRIFEPSGLNVTIPYKNQL